MKIDWGHIILGLTAIYLASARGGAAAPGGAASAIETWAPIIFSFLGVTPPAQTPQPPVV